jgi:ribosomal protein L30
MRRTLEALGLRHHQQTVKVANTPSARGMLYKVRHLVEVKPAGKSK